MVSAGSLFHTTNHYRLTIIGSIISDVLIAIESKWERSLSIVFKTTHV
jgi:hypothetical protein